MLHSIVFYNAVVRSCKLGEPIGKVVIQCKFVATLCSQGNLVSSDSSERSSLKGESTNTHQKKFCRQATQNCLFQLAFCAHKTSDHSRPIAADNCFQLEKYVPAPA